MKQLDLRSIIYCGLMVCLCASSCGEYENLEIEKEAKRLADSIYRSERDSISRHYDDQCSELRDSLFSVYFDSLKLVEAQKIKQLIDR